jgi:hypothetical protein
VDEQAALVREVSGARRDAVELNALLQRLVVRDAAGNAIEEVRSPRRWRPW